MRVYEYVCVCECVSEWVCVYMCVRVCEWVSECVCIRVWVLCVCEFLLVNVCVSEWVYVCVYVCICVSVYVSVCVRAWIRACVCVSCNKLQILDQWRTEENSHRRKLPKDKWRQTGLLNFIATLTVLSPLDQLCRLRLQEETDFSQTSVWEMLCQTISTFPHKCTLLTFEFF